MYIPAWLIVAAIIYLVIQDEFLTQKLFKLLGDLVKAALLLGFIILIYQSFTSAEARDLLGVVISWGIAIYIFRTIYKDRKEQKEKAKDKAFMDLIK